MPVIDGKFYGLVPAVKKLQEERDIYRAALEVIRDDGIKNHAACIETARLVLKNYPLNDNN